MRTLLISDLHADPSAFDHVLRQSEHAWDTIVSLGDLVGYGGEPEEVVQMLRQLNPYVTLKGNHEEMVVRVASGNPPELDTKTLQMVERQVAALSQQSLDFLAGLPEKHLTPGWGAVHGTPRNPLWEYLLSVPVARANYSLMERRLYLVGHTHIPSAFIFDQTHERWHSLAFRSPQATLQLESGQATFFNPGSVSQSRDGLDTISYAILDEEAAAIEVFRCAR